MKEPDPRRDKYVEDLLLDYDKKRIELRKIEIELRKECTEYGLRKGVWGFSPDHLRMRMAALAADKKERA